MTYSHICLVLLFALFTSCESLGWLSEDLGTPINEVKFTAKINKLDPKGTKYPGGRGENELVIYTPVYGKQTGTSPWGTEAVVVNGIVQRIGNNNSIIPKDGFVVSGNEEACRWINKHLEIGMNLSMEGMELICRKSENTNIQEARLLYHQAQKRLKSSGLHQKKCIINEHELTALFKEFKHAKSNGRKSHAFDISKKILAEMRDAYYATYANVNASEFRGVWVRLSDETPDELRQTIKEMAAAGFNAILPETIYNGYAIYPNAHPLLPQLPQFEGWDPMEVMVEECAKYNMKLIVWTEMFFVGWDWSPIVAEKPEWIAQFRNGERAAQIEKGFHYMCPSRSEVHDFLRQALDKLASTYKIEGVQLDYIRYSVSEPWEKGMCYCDFCREKVQKKLGFDPLAITPDDSLSWEQWNAYRVNNISSFVKDTKLFFKGHYPNIPLSVAVFPNSQMSKREKFQDWTSWVAEKWIDEVYIMSYSLDSNIIKDDTGQMVNRVGQKNILPIAGLGPFMKFNPHTLLEQIDVARKCGVKGVCLFAWHSLSNEHKRALSKGAFSK